MNETDNDNDIEDDYPDNDIEDECACSRRFQCPHMTHDDADPNRDYARHPMGGLLDELRYAEDELDTDEDELDAETALGAIHALMNAETWSPDTLGAIAEILARAGYQPAGAE